jgi:DNA-binding NarL/FixJ family response regulator
MIRSISIEQARLYIGSKQTDCKPQAAKPRTLAPRLIDVAKGIWQGKVNKQIAFDLHIAENTVKVHRRRLRKLIGAASTAGIALWYERMNMRPMPVEDHAFFDC